MEKATLGGGCFWCVEAVFTQIRGVQAVVSGYMGGASEQQPTYQEVCTGQTGFAEVVEVEFDSSVLSYIDVLEIFMLSHDPTTLNRQGEDVGTQYRSVVFYHSETQKKEAQDVLQRMQDHFPQDIVTEISPAKIFFPAEDYHQNYYAQNPNQPYCAAVITPKLAAVRKKISDRLKS